MFQVGGRYNESQRNRGMPADNTVGKYLQREKINDAGAGDRGISLKHKCTQEYSVF